jgi:hypothetical protein
MALQHFGPWPLCQLLNPTHTGLLGRGISLSRGRYLHTEEHKQNKRTNIHAVSGIRTHDPSVGASKDGTLHLAT